jgi:hypothetical protein
MGMRILTLTVAAIAGALFAAPSVFAQGAVSSDMSFYAPAQFKDVQCMRHDGTNNEPVAGMLTFDASKGLRCGAGDHTEFAVAYSSVLRLVLTEGNASPFSSSSSPAASSGWGFHALLAHKDMLKPLNKSRYLSIVYKDADGNPQTTAVRLDGNDWKLIMAVAQNKTGHSVERSSRGEGW